MGACGVAEGGGSGRRGRKGGCTRIAGVSIRLDGALGDFQIVLCSDLVEGVFPAAKKLASIAMAER